MADIELTKQYKTKEFWLTFIIYIILSLVSIILTGMVLMGGSNRKALLWTLFAFSILTFIATVTLLMTRHRVWALVMLTLQFFLNLMALIMTNNAGNVVAEDPTGQFSTTGKYTAAVVFTILYLLPGMLSIYFERSPTSI